MSDFKPYLQSAHIEGYKSIVSCDVTFKPGLNIIIGKNGTGKTNLLEFLAAGLDFESAGDGSPTGMLSVCDGRNQRRLVDIKLHGLGTFNNHFGSHVSSEFYGMDGDGNVFPSGPALWDHDAKLQWSDLHENAFPLFWKHQLPSKVLLFDEPMRLAIRGQVSVMDERDRDDDPLFVQMLTSKLRTLKFASNTPELEIWSVLKECFSFVSQFDLAFKSYTPITAIRVSPHFIISNGIIDGTWEAFNIQLEFLMNDRWLRFQQLSDGTKRLAMLMFEVYCARGYVSGQNHSEPNFEGRGRFLLIEEPEIGVHPHQLHLVVNFLKEMSLSEQVVLTTHSPQVLDILDASDLDRIIIADFDPKLGTTFRNLNKKESSKAKRYMKELQLSDYWRFSDLEMR